MQRLYLAVVQNIFCGISLEACMIFVEGLARFSPYLHSGPGLASRVSTSGFLVATVTQSSRSIDRKPRLWVVSECVISCVIVRMRRLPIPHNLFSKAAQPEGYPPPTFGDGILPKRAIALQKGWASRKPMCCRCGSVQLDWEVFPLDAIGR